MEQFQMKIPIPTDFVPAENRSDHDNYACSIQVDQPSTSTASQIATEKHPGNSNSLKKNGEISAPRLASALDTLWKLKMNSIRDGNDKSHRTSMNRKPKVEPVEPTRRRLRSAPKRTDNSPEDEMLSENGSEPGDLLETSASAYGGAHPQYVTEFGTMEYPLQPQHLNNNNTTYSVYQQDAASYPYYQYSGTVHSPGNYVVNGSNSPISADDEHNSSLQQVTRASPATVGSRVLIQWLTDNYEPSDGTSLPRCTLYDHYKRHCTEYNLEPVNAASFGKLIRNVFQNLRTRRLGTRGNSKYHYYGIRIKPTSSLSRSHCMENHYSSEEPEMPPRQALKRPAPMSQPSMDDDTSPVYPPSANIPSQPASQPSVPNQQPVTITEQDKASLGNAEMPNINFEIPINLHEDVRKLGLQLSDVCRFFEAYKISLSDVVYCVKNIQFDAIEDYWTSFWQPEEDEEDLHKMNTRLSQQQIFSLCTLPQVQNFVVKLDLAVYQLIVDVLVPDVLMSQMTPFLTQACRNFAKNAEGYLKKAMNGVPDALQRKKIQAVKYMAQGLRRYTSLNHLAQAARAVLQKQEQVNAMYHDYIRVDISQVQEQAGWVCGCDSMLVRQIHAAFKDNLQKMAPMNEWAEWMESIVDQNVQILSNYHDKPVREVIEIGKQFLLNWSFYTSMMIRDLTLRSAASFGSFHLLRLLTDEYMVYLVEAKLSKVMNRPMIAVLSQPTDYNLFDDDHNMSSTPQTTVLPPISLGYLPHDHMMYGDKFVMSSDQHIANQVVLDPSGDMMLNMTEMKASPDLL